jgi:hypothetical protein
MVKAIIYSQKIAFIKYPILFGAPTAVRASFLISYGYLKKSNNFFISSGLN